MFGIIGYVRGHRENQYNAYTGGMSEEEQIRRATEESRRYYTRSQGRNLEVL